jgi:hypothetical protein
MKLSMWMVYDALSSSVVHHNLNNLSRKTCIQGVSIYSDEESLSERHVYIKDISNGEAFEIPVCNAYVVLVGENVTACENSTCQYVVLPAEYGFERAFHDVRKAIDKYLEWFDALQNELDGDADLTHFCELGCLMLQNPVAVYDKNYILLAVAGDLNMSYLENDRGPYKVMSSKLLMKLKNEPEYIKAIGTSGAGIQKSRHVPITNLFVNFINSNVFEGRVCVPMDTRSVRESDYQVIEILAHFIRSALKKQNLNSDSRRSSFRHFLVDIMDGAGISEERLEYFLTQWHWQNEDRYLCIYIEMDENDVYTSSSNYMLNKLENILRDSCSFFYDKGLVSIIHLISDEEQEEIIEKVTEFSMETQHHLGVSDMFKGILRLKLAYLEATIALSMGLQYSPAEWHYYFRDYAELHFFLHGVSLLLPFVYCDSDIRKLAAYKNTKVDYYSTLKVYLENNMNLLHTAEKLYIHRTTLFHRLKHIEEMISADLSDSETRVRLLTSFKLMEMGEIYSRSRWITLKETRRKADRQVRRNECARPVCQLLPILIPSRLRSPCRATGSVFAFSVSHRNCCNSKRRF